MIVSLRALRLWQFTEIVSGACVVGVGLARIDAHIGVGHALAFVALLALGALLIYCFWLVLATGAFWLVNMWFLSDMFEGI